MTKPHNACIAVEYLDQEGNTKKRYTQVGVGFFNEHNGETVVNLKLDFPVGATEIVLFPPKSQNDTE